MEPNSRRRFNGTRVGGTVVHGKLLLEQGKQRAAHPQRTECLGSGNAPRYPRFSPAFRFRGGKPPISSFRFQYCCCIRLRCVSARTLGRRRLPASLSNSSFQRRAPTQFGKRVLKKHIHPGDFATPVTPPNFPQADLWPGVNLPDARRPECGLTTPRRERWGHHTQLS